MNDLLNKYGVVGFAAGGDTTRAIQDWYAANEGKGTQADLDRFLASGYTAEQINAALPQWGVADLQNAINTAKQNVSAQDTSGFVTGPVVGPGGNDNFQMAGGTRAEGYSRDYTPEQRIGINQAWIRAQQDAGYGVEGLMRDMEKTGVTVQDLALSYGMDPGSVGQYLIRHGADPSFGGIDTNWDRQAQDEFIRWQAQQRDQFGNIIGETWAKQGITDPYSDPLIRARAQEQVERNARREAMLRNAGGGGFTTGPGGGGGGGGTPPPPPGPPAPPPGPSVPPPYQPPPFTPPPVVSPPAPFTGPSGTIYPNTIQTSSGPQPTYFPTSWWTGSPSASLAYGMTAPLTAPDFNAQMEEYRKKYAPAAPAPGTPAQAPAPAAPAPGTPGSGPNNPPTEYPGYGYIWVWESERWFGPFGPPGQGQWVARPDPNLRPPQNEMSELRGKYRA